MNATAEIGRNAVSKIQIHTGFLFVYLRVSHISMYVYMVTCIADVQSYLLNAYGLLGKSDQ